MPATVRCSLGVRVGVVLGGQGDAGVQGDQVDRGHAGGHRTGPDGSPQEGFARLGEGVHAGIRVLRVEFPVP